MFKLNFYILLTLTAISCASQPKGEYSESKIERPYNLPYDVAKFSFGAEYSIDKVSEPIEELGDADTLESGYPFITAENGWLDRFSWIFPLGFRWNILKTDTQDFGISAYTSFFITHFSIDYWYEFHWLMSFRPYYRSKQVKAVLFESSRDALGIELVYQFTKKFAFSPRYELGRYSVDSNFIEQVFEENFEVRPELYNDGLLSSYGLEVLYSISDAWDVVLLGEQDLVQFSDYDLRTTKLSLTFSFFY
ncbi:MAG: hypothetical protein CME62_00760 [Halobacteriovoraceae bacterium]|nr:hypothetical protein [Halobacteriovoraceae bacterium]|tara:strand:+ start:6469 stop:7215 length:747 start_codon:yes stop_codon:yes gene_type:complete